jgi:hypothetical protein
MIKALLLFFISLSFLGLSQSRLDSVFKSTESMGYISAKEGFGNLPSLLFEGMIQNKFYLSVDKKNKWAISFEPKVNVRMKMEHSFPIINPSFHAIGDVLYKPKTNQEIMRFWSLRVGHHSNGQEDYFYDWVKQDIDYEDGSFSTNYLALGYNDCRQKIWGNSKVVIRRKLEFEAHPNLYRNPYMDDMYDDLRLNGTYVVRKNKDKGVGSMMLEVESTLLCEQFSFNRLVSGETFTLRTRYSYQFLPSADVWAYAEYYHGQDYYNLYFNNILDVLKIGLLIVPKKAPIFH